MKDIKQPTNILKKANTICIEFPDKILKRAIRNNLGIPFGDIYFEDVKDIYILECTGQQDQHIKNLTGIENLTALAKLNLCNNQIIDIALLKGLDQICQLYLSDNRIIDITTLTNLKDLYSLELVNNQVCNIEALRNLDKLKFLDLSFNNITNISALSNLSKLIELDLSENKITDITPLLNNKHLKNTEINLARNTIPIEQIQELRKQCNDVIYSYIKYN